MTSMKTFAHRRHTCARHARCAGHDSSRGRQLSLADAVQMGESQSEAIRIARAGVQRTGGQQLQARSQYLPQIYGSGSYTRTLKSQYSGAFGGTTDTRRHRPHPQVRATNISGRNGIC